MTRPGRGEDGKDAVDVGHDDRVELGGARDRGRSGWVVWFGIVVIAIVTVIVATHHGDAAPSTASPTVTQPPGNGTGPASPTPAPSAMPWKALGATGGWEIIARGPASLLRITPATGEIVTTAAPALASDGPVNLVAGPDFTLVRPLDAVPGYVVRDGRPAAGIATGGGYVIAGPKPTEFWTESQDPYSPTVTLSLTDISSRGLGPVISNINRSSSLMSDFAGNVLERRTDGYYDDTPTSSTLITTGQLVAAGPTRWLVSECVGSDPCQAIVINRATGARHVLAGFTLTVDDYVGSISQNGKLAAVYAPGPDGTEQVHLVDLAVGTDVAVPALLPDPIAPSSLAWSPESTWLFLADRAGRIDAVNPTTADVSPLGLGGQAVVQLVIRPAP